MGLLENTLVLFISDNGGEPLTGANNLPLSGSKYTMHEGGIRVPFMASWPGVLPKGRFYSHRVSAFDIVPTCLEAAGIQTSDSIRFDGVSLLEPVKKNIPSKASKEPLCFQFGNQWAIIDDGWKLVYAEDYNPMNRLVTSQILLGANSGEVALYNLKEDEAERNNLLEKEPEKADFLKQKFDNWLQNMREDHENYEFWKSNNKTKGK